HPLTLHDALPIFTWHTQISSGRDCHTAHFRSVRKAGTFKLLREKSPVEFSQPFINHIFLINPPECRFCYPEDLRRSKVESEHIIEEKVMEFIRAYQVLCLLGYLTIFVRKQFRTYR